MMRHRNVLVVASLVSVLIFGVSTPWPMQAQDNSYPTSMAPLDQYLMDRADEIALARSAASRPVKRAQAAVLHSFTVSQ
jgi:hypothetical protein